MKRDRKRVIRMAASDQIARFIMELLANADGSAELKRANLADQFGCVPSQINYVIATRFSPEHGYIVESRRGGGGYIRITRVRTSRSSLIMHMVNTVGDELDYNSAVAFLSNAADAGAIEAKEIRLIHAAIGNNSLKGVDAETRDSVRASIFKHMLLSTIAE